MSVTKSVAERLAQITAGKSLGDVTVQRDLLTLLKRMFSASDGRIYSLDLSTGTFRSELHSLHGESAAEFDARRLRTRRGWGMLEEAATSGQIRASSTKTTWIDDKGGRHTYGSRLVLPLRRGRSTTVGLVDLRHARAGAFVDFAREVDQTSPVLHLLSNAYEARTVDRILRQTAQFKISPSGEWGYSGVSETERISHVLDFVHVSSGMQYVALRRRDSDSELTCIGTRGFGSVPNDDFTLTADLEEFPNFALALKHKEAREEVDIFRPGNETLRRMPHLRDVRSYVVCPILVGGRTWGLMSFAACVEYEYSPLEIHSLRVLANLAGSTLEVDQSIDQVSEARFDDGRLMQAVLSNEIVVAARHEMSDQVEVIAIASDVVDSFVKRREAGSRATRAEVAELSDTRDAIDDALVSLRKILDTVKLAQGDLSLKAEVVPLKDAIDAAVEPFKYRRTRAKVTSMRTEVPRSLKVVASFDWARVVFMHLIINSLDAFERDIVPRKNRRILIHVHAQHEDRVVVRYSDNAGGIGFRDTFRRRGEVVVSEDIGELIFEQFVTSKGKGTGLGLSSCRTALERMDASIAVIDYQGGMTFDLTFALPRRVR